MATNPVVMPAVTVNNLRAELSVTDIVSQRTIVDLVLNNLAYNSGTSIFVPYLQVTTLTYTIPLPSPVCFQFYIKNISQPGNNVFTVGIGGPLTQLVGGASGQVYTVALYPGDVFIIWQNFKPIINPGFTSIILNAFGTTATSPVEIQYFIGA